MAGLTIISSIWEVKGVYEHAWVLEVDSLGMQSRHFTFRPPGPGVGARDGDRVYSREHHGYFGSLGAGRDCHHNGCGNWPKAVSHYPGRRRIQRSEPCDWHLYG